MGNTFDSFDDLPEKLQLEALREGETLLQTQLTVATAADQRALSWAGLLLTGASASLGGAFALQIKAGSAAELQLLAVLVSAALFISAWLAIRTVAPKPYCLPGNTPGSWLPAEWNCIGSTSKKIANARRDQASQIHKFIEANAQVAKENAVQMRLSVGIAFFAVLAAWCSFVVHLIATP